MNDPATVSVRPGPIRSGSAVGRTVEGLEAGSALEPPSNRIDAEASRAEHPRLLDWVPTAEPATVTAGDYPIEGGVPHPHWTREAAQHRLAAHPVLIAESAAVMRLLLVLVVAAFLLGMTVFYPVSPLGH